MEEDKKEEVVEKVNHTQNQDTQAKVVQTPKKDRKGFCIASMVLGIVALVFFCIWYISIPCAILAIIFGILGVKTPTKGMAIAGLVTGSIGLVISITIIILIAIGVMISATGFSDDDYTYRNRNYRNYHHNSSWYDYD